MNQKKTLEDKVFNFITDNSLITPKDSVLVAFSGGADSVCLLYLLNKLKKHINFKLYAAHLNHGLRGKAAEHDENFCVEFCKKFGVECFVFSEDVRLYAKNHGISEELAGRELRYKHFFDTMESHSISKLSVGHHLNDQAETIMLHLMRGCGIDGLSGMRSIQNNIIRPLLLVSKQEILDYLKEENIVFCTDETNFETVYSRNKVRLELIPKMQEFNENILNSLSNTAAILQGDADFLDEMAQKEFMRLYSDSRCNIEKLLAQNISIRRRIIIKMIAKAKNKSTDISLDYINKILKLSENKKTGKCIDIGDGVFARIEYENLVIEKAVSYEEFSCSILENSPMPLPYSSSELLLKANPHGKFLFPENASFTIRNKIDGDRFSPLGINGTKKLKDFFIDEKIPRPERQKTVVFLCNEEIAFFICAGKLFYDRRFYNETNGNYDISILERDDFKE